MTAAEALRAEVEAFLAGETDAPATVVKLQPLAGGASMETWALDVAVGDAVLPLVLRRDMGQNMYADALTRPQEFRLLGVAHAAGVLAPRPRWLCADAGRPYFLMDRLSGESIGRRVVRLPALAAARARLAAQMGEQLARIHAVPLAPDVDFLPRPPAGRAPSLAALDALRATIDGLALANPVWEHAWRWLSRRAPTPRDPSPLVLVHGDFRVGNLLVTPDGLAGVLDWEFARVGDPHDDLAWPLVRDWRFERDDLPVGGVGHLDDYLRAYESASGRVVDRVALRWWELLGNLRWAVVCHAQAGRHLKGVDRSVEYASLGRKASEVEWEILDLIRREEGR